MIIARGRSIGSYLEHQRRLRGLTLDELATTTRLPRRSLERLEQGAFDGQTDGFARGFVRTVALALGLDPVDTVARMLSEPERDTRRRHWISRKRARGAALASGAALAVVTLALWLFSALALPPPSDRAGADADLVYRRDPVRELAKHANEVASSDARPSPAGPLGAMPSHPAPE